jgi:predicted dehydrogenase
VGVGGMGQCAHLRNYATLPDCEVVALAELRPKLGALVAQRYGVPRVYASHKELLAQEDVDGLVAIQPFALHVKLVPDLLAKGVPVLTEKPLAESLESGRQILDAVQRTRGRLYLTYHKRSDPATCWVKQQIDAWRKSGEVGMLRYLRLTMPPGNWAAEGFAPLLRTEEKYDAPPWDPSRYNAFVNYYIHQVNLMRFLLGEDYQVLFADPAGVLYVARSTGGVAAALEMAPYQTTIDWQEEALVCFERGWIKLELPAPLAVDRPGRVTVYHDPGQGAEPRTFNPTLPWVHAMRQQAIHFVQAIRGEPTVLCGPEDALKDLHVAQQYVELLEESERKHAPAGA